MRHIPDGVLRRLDDEPLAVPDRVTEHLSSCERCGARRAQIAEDTELTAQLFSGPQLVPDTDLAWARLRRTLESPPAGGAIRRGRPVVARPWRTRFPSISLRAALAIGALGIVVGGTAAAASLTTIFAPTHVAPVSVSRADLRAIAAVAGLGDGRSVGVFSTPSGSSTLRFGTLRWSSGAPRTASSAAGAATLAGFPVTLPTHLPAGVGAIQQLLVQPRVQATVSFNQTAGSFAGSSVKLDVGPAVVAEYGGTGASDVPTLGVVTIRRPTARSTGASITQIEAFLLRQPGSPPELAEELRLLGNPDTTLPVPVPSGVSARSVRVGGRPGVLLTDPSNAASAVVWEDGAGLLHAVGGILDSHDVLNVAAGLG